VAFYAVPQLGRDIEGVPFGIAWIALAAVLAVGLGAARAVIAHRHAPRPPVPATDGVAPLASAASLLSATPLPSATDRVAPLASAGVPLIAAILAAWTLYDLLLWLQPGRMYDLYTYLGSSSRWLDGANPYLASTVSAWPSDARNDFFLYAPPLLPFFGLLSRLPDAAAVVGWTTFSAGCWYAGLRALGLGRATSVALLLFPPIMIGLQSGNVAGVTFLLFAAGFRRGSALVLDGLFKVQAGVPVLWLLRERRWRSVGIGVALVVGLVLATLPLTGIEAWGQWWAGLGFRAASQPLVESLYGFSYARVLPPWTWLALAAGFTLAALLFRGRLGLSALGLASIFASPALWPHGFAFALPAILAFESGAVAFVVLGCGSFGSNQWLLFGVGWVALLAARGRATPGRRLYHNMLNVGQVPASHGQVAGT
jgi:hypothetical protein